MASRLLYRWTFRVTILLAWVFYFIKRINILWVYCIVEPSNSLFFGLSCLLYNEKLSWSKRSHAIETYDQDSFPFIITSRRLVYIVRYYYVGIFWWIVLKEKRDFREVVCRMVKPTPNKYGVEIWWSLLLSSAHFNKLLYYISTSYLHILDVFAKPFKLLEQEQMVPMVFGLFMCHTFDMYTTLRIFGHVIKWSWLCIPPFPFNQTHGPNYFIT